MTITGKHDVYEFLVDGQSGLIPGDVSGKVVLCGVCSKGEAGKAYRLGTQSDVKGVLGTGPLVDAVQDAFAGAAAAGNQNSILIALPVAGTAGGYISPISKKGSGSMPRAIGYAAENADIIVKITSDGLPGTCTYSLSTDGGKTFGKSGSLPVNGEVNLAEQGVNLVFDEETELIKDTEYSFVTRLPIGPIVQIGQGPSVSIEGTVLAGAEIQLLVTKSGKLNEGQYQLSVDGGDTFGLIKTLPYDGVIPVKAYGVSITLETSEYKVGSQYSCTLLPPVPTIGTVMEALELPLARLDPEIIHIVGPTDAVDWTALSMLAQAQFEKHRPVIITCESRLPADGEDLDAWTDWLLDERAKGDNPYVSCCVAFGEIEQRDGTRNIRNCGGLMMGKLMAIPVQRHIGRVKDGAITPLSVPTAWNDAIQVALRDAGFITVQWYEGLNGVYWGDDKVMAPIISTYQFLVVLRVSFKAIRLMRIQALKSMFDEAGDVILESNASGLSFLKVNLEAALDVMTTARPQELAGAVVNIPTGQDIVNNGVDVEIDLIGIPIIKRIRLFANYVYAGSRFDPRVTKTEVVK